MVYHRLALLGDPVRHSRSPEIHRVLFDLSGLEGEYSTVRAGRPELIEAMAGLRAGDWDGLNVTMPLKRDAADLADRLGPEAARSLSVNTLVPSRGAAVGHSTDATAFATLFSDSRFDPSGPIHILGSGGSAAAALAAANADVPVFVSARRPDAARNLITFMNAPTRNPGLRAPLSDAGNPGFAESGVVPWGKPVVGAVVVNTTPLGMAGEELPLDVLEGGSGLIDLPYGAEPTPAVEWARRSGIPFADGHEFLVRQAIASFRLWTGVEPDYRSVLDKLRKP